MTARAEFACRVRESPCSTTTLEGRLLLCVDTICLANHLTDVPIAPGPVVQVRLPAGNGSSGLRGAGVQEATFDGVVGKRGGSFVGRRGFFGTAEAAEQVTAYGVE
jgi:hypothetical protein